MDMSLKRMIKLRYAEIQQICVLGQDMPNISRSPQNNNIEVCSIAQNQSQKAAKGLPAVDKLINTSIYEFYQI